MSILTSRHGSAGIYAPASNPRPPLVSQEHSRVSWENSKKSACPNSRQPFQRIDIGAGGPCSASSLDVPIEDQLIRKPKQRSNAAILGKLAALRSLSCWSEVKNGTFLVCCGRAARNAEFKSGAVYGSAQNLARSSGRCYGGRSQEYSPCVVLVMDFIIWSRPGTCQTTGLSSHFESKFAAP